MNPRLPIWLGTGTEANVKLTAEIADGWLPLGFVPRLMPMLRPWLEEGFRRAGGGKGFADFEIQARAEVAITDDVRGALARMKPRIALYVGGMGHRDKNFHNEMMVRRGFGDAAARIQELYLAGRKDEAVAAVPDEFCDEMALVGPVARIRERYRAWADSGITGLTIVDRATRGDRADGEPRPVSAFCRIRRALPCLRLKTLTCPPGRRYDARHGGLGPGPVVFTRAEYERLIDLGVFQPDEAIELIAGELMVAEPQGAPHYTAILKTAKALEAAFGPGWVVRTHGPIGLDDDSEPSPTSAVVPGARTTCHSHPRVRSSPSRSAGSSLALDRQRKGSHARAGLSDYWCSI